MKNISNSIEPSHERKVSRRVPTPIEFALGFTAAFGLAIVVGATVNPDEFWGSDQQIIEQPAVETNQCELPVQVGVGGSAITNQLMDNLNNT